MGEFEHLLTLDTLHNHAHCQVIRMNILLSAPSRPPPRTPLSLGVVVDPLSHFAAEAFPVAAEVVGSLDVEWILEVGEVGEETVEAPDHVLDPPGGGPAQPIEAVRSEEGEADGAVHRDVGVPQLGEAQHVRRRHVVLQRDLSHHTIYY